MDTGNPACNSNGGQPGYYGTLTSMTLPTGATITYGYSNFFGVGYNAIGNYNASHWLTSKSSSAGHWSYTPTVTSPAGKGNPCLSAYKVGCMTTAVQRPDGSKEVTSFIVDPLGGSYPQQVLSYDTDGATLLSTVNNAWDFTHACEMAACLVVSKVFDESLGYSYVQKVSTSATLPVPGGSISKQTTYTYTSFEKPTVSAINYWGYRTGSAPTFPAVPDKATYIDYHTDVTINDIIHPDKQTVCNNVGTDTTDCPAGGSMVTQTKTSYDTYGSGNVLALVPAAGFVNHDDANFGQNYTTRGNPTVVKRWVSGSTYLTTSLSYDTTGQLVQGVDPAGNKKTYSWNDAFYTDNGSGAPTPYTPPAPTHAYLTSVADAIGTTQSGYYYGSGQVALSEDYNSAQTNFHYADVFDRPTETDLPIGWNLNTYTSHLQSDSYSPVGNLSPSTSCTSCMHTQSFLDGVGRTSRTVQVNNPACAVTVTTSYDGNNRIVAVSHPNCGSGDPNDVSESMTYDGLGRSLSVKHPDGESVQTAYGAKVTSLGGLSTQQNTAYGIGFPDVTVDESGNLKQQWLDGFGRIIEVDEPSGAGGLTTPFVTNYVYDPLGNLTQVIEGVQTRTYSYDGLSRLTQQLTPEASTTTSGVTVQNPVTLSYVTTKNAVCSGNPSNPCVKTDASGIVTTYTYDKASRLTGKTHVPTTTGPESYTYGTSAALYNIGRLLTMTDPSGSESYTYDQMGRTTSRAKVIGGQTYNIGYLYDAGGQLIQTTYPSLRVVQDSYDNGGHLCEVAPSTSGCGTAASPFITGFTYDAAAHPLGAKYGNGIVASATYWPLRSQLQSLAFVQGTATVFSENYYYQQNGPNCPTGNTGNNGEIQCVTDSVQPGRSAHYTYDVLERLSTANTAGSTAFPAWGLSETYDRYGNRTGQAVTAGSAFSSLLTINPANNQITSPAFTYDASGHVTAEPAPLSATYTYDGEECLTGYTGSADSATYTCDGNHLRVEKVDKGTNAVSTVYLYSGGKLIAEYDNGVAVNSPSREYIYGHQLNAIIVGSVGGAGGTITYLLRDHLSPRVYSNSSGTDIGDRGHYPFGEVWYNTYTGTSNWFFTSYERDQESQLDYALARSYSNSLGRFMSPDAVAGRAVNPQSWNRYVYVLDDPIDGTDPSGNCWPPSACGQSFISWVNGLQQRAQNWAIGTGNPALAAQVTYTTGVTATVVDGTTALLTNPGPTLASVLTVGSALGAVWDSGDPQAILLGAVQDGGKVGALALVMAAPLVSPVESAAATPELTAAPTPAAATPPPPSYVFYSGPYAEEAATQWSAANNGIMIQQTEFGQAINNGTMTDAEASTAFAQSASGTAQVFSTAPFTNFGNIWFNYELPELADNPAVPNLVFNPVPDLSGENLGWDLGSTDLLDLDFIDWDF